MVTVSTVCAVYYNIIMAWTVYFLLMSLRAVLPWATCDNDWNTDACSLNRNSTSGKTFFIYQYRDQTCSERRGFQRPPRGLADVSLSENHV